MLKPSQMTDEGLLFCYSTTLNQLNQLYKDKKEFEEEINKRNSIYKERYQRGEFKLEQEVKNESDSK